MAERVENNDTQRVAEQRALDKRMQEKTNLQKSSENAARFSKMVGKQNENIKHAQTKQSTSKDSKTNTKRTNQDTRTAVKGGIQRSNVDSLKQRAESSLKRSVRDRDDKDEKIKRSDVDNQKQTNQTALVRDRLAALEFDDKRGGGHKQGGDGSSDSSKKAGEKAVLTGSSTAAGSTNFQGVMKTTPSGSAAKAIPAALIDMVKRMYAGMNKQGLGIVHIDLQDNVLKGTSLTLRQTSSNGLHLEFDVTDENTDRLLSSGATARELQNTLKESGIALESLVVNRKKVLGSFV